MARREKRDVSCTAPSAGAISKPETFEELRNFRHHPLSPLIIKQAALTWHQPGHHGTFTLIVGKTSATLYSNVISS
jgi:hypothetical protein